MDDDEKAYWGSDSVKPKFGPQPQTQGSSALQLDFQEDGAEPYDKQRRQRDRRRELSEGWSVLQGGLSEAERNSTNRTRGAESLDELRESEEDPDDTSEVNFTGKGRRSEDGKRGKEKKGAFKKAGPVGGVVVGLALLVFGGLFLFGPATLFNNIKQLMSNKLDTSGYVSNRRKANLPVHLYFPLQSISQVRLWL